MEKFTDFERIKRLVKKHKESGVLCCSMCGKPSGIYKLMLKKIPNGKYVCQYCVPELWDKSRKK